MHETISDLLQREILELETVYDLHGNSDCLEITTSGACLFDPEGVRGIVATLNQWLAEQGQEAGEEAVDGRAS